MNDPTLFDPTLFDLTPYAKPPAPDEIVRPTAQAIPALGLELAPDGFKRAQLYGFHRGGRVVHSAWITAKLCQGRNVEPARRSWDNLSAPDRLLDRGMAFACARDYALWCVDHYANGHAPKPVTLSDAVAMAKPITLFDLRGYLNDNTATLDQSRWAVRRGGQVAHDAWVTGMVIGDRYIKPELKTWDGMAERDQVIFSDIAVAVAADLLAWIEAGAPGIPT